MEQILMGSCFYPGPPEQFDSWLSSFSMEDTKGEISELLVNSPSIRALYTKMVSIVAFVSLEEAPIACSLIILNE